ncbi:MAG: PAS domain S-box protein [Balneolaceae bacterium]|nr:PAS domain S-box protein [Balneolaceae bacterium]
MSKKLLKRIKNKKTFWSWDVTTGQMSLGESLRELLDLEETRTSESLRKWSSFFEEKLEGHLNEFVQSKSEALFERTTVYNPEDCEREGVLVWSGEVVEYDKEEKPVRVAGQVECRWRGNNREFTMDEKAMLFETIMEYLPDSVYFKDKEGKYLAINEAALGILGLEEISQVLGKTNIDFFDKAHAEATRADEQQIMKTETPLVGKEEQVEIADLSNNPRWITTSKMPLYDMDGEVMGTFGISRDITSQKEAEILLQKNDRILKNLSRQVPGFFYTYQQTLGGNGRFSFASEGIRDIYELDPEDVKETIQPVVDRIHEEDVERVLGTMRKSAQALEPWELEFRVILPEKGERWLRERASAIKGPDDTIIGYGYVSDITKEMKAYKENEHLRRQFEAVLDTAPNLIFIKDLEGRYLMANKAASDFFEQKGDEIIGKTDIDIGIDEEKARALNELDKEVVEKDSQLLIPADKTIDKEGNELWHQTIKVPFYRTDSGEPSVLSVATNITQRKKKEKELNRSLDIIGQQNKRLTNFAHIVSHNLRNHAGNISMLLSLYGMEESEEEQQDLFKHLNAASERLNESIADLNEIIDQQYKFSNDRKRVNLSNYLSKIKEILTSKILSENVVIKENVPEDLNFDYNPVYLESILLNLLSNAIKYRHPDRRPVIELSAYEEEGHVHFSITDNGLGIDLDKYGGKLFGMYETFHENKNSKGIGLFITKNQIESMGGSIAAESIPGKKTTFNMVLA